MFAELFLSACAVAAVFSVLTSRIAVMVALAPAGVGRVPSGSRLFITGRYSETQSYYSTGPGPSLTHVILGQDELWLFIKHIRSYICSDSLIFSWGDHHQTPTSKANDEHGKAGSRYARLQAVADSVETQSGRGGRATRFGPGIQRQPSHDST